MKSHRWRAASAAIVAFLVAALMLAATVAPRLSYADQPTDDIAASRPLVESGIAAYRSGDYARAINDLSQAERLFPANSAVLLYLGLAYLKQNRLNDAVAAWRLYLTLAPSTEAERQNDLDQKVPQFVTLLRQRIDREQVEQALKHERTIGPGDPNAIAITYFRNLGSPGLSSFQKGLTALLIDDISKLPGIKVVDREQLQVLLDELKPSKSGLANPKSAAREGRLLGAGLVATGSYLDPTKGALDIDSVLIKTGPGSAERRVQIAQGQVAQFYDLEKDLARKIIADLGYDMSKLDPAVVASVEQPQTRSLNAFEKFSRGLDERDHGRLPIARALFQRALDYDPNFELAKRELLFTPIARFTVAQVESHVSSSAPSAAAAAAVATAAIAAAAVASAGGTGGNGSGAGNTAAGGATTTGGGTEVTGGGSSASAPTVFTNPLPLNVPPPAPALGCPPLVCPACVQVHR